MAKHGSLKYQLKNRMKQLDRRGESRHQAKQEAKAAGIHQKGGTVGIHSHNTFDGYWTHGKAFCDFLKSEGIKKLDDVTKEHAIKYLTTEKERGLRPATLDTKQAALNKVFRLDLHKKDSQLPPTRIGDVVKGRNGQQGRYDPEKWKDHTDFAKATGVRRSSIHTNQRGNWKVVPSSLWKRESDNKLMVSVIEKGGKYRQIPVLEQHKERVIEIVQERAGHDWQPVSRDSWTESEYRQAYRAGNETPLFSSYTKEINNHAYRREYAEERYREILGGREDRQDYRGYDLEVCRELSRDLGHFRPSVVVDSYIGQE